MQQFSAVTWSLKRYQQLSYPLLYAVIQTDTKKLLIRRKDSTNRGQKQPRVRGCFAEVQSVFCKDSTNRGQKQPRLRGCFAEAQSVFCKDSTNRAQKQPRLRSCFAEVQSVFCAARCRRETRQYLRQLNSMGPTAPHPDGSETEMMPPAVPKREPIKLLNNTQR